MHGQHLLNFCRRAIIASRQHLTVRERSSEALEMHSSRVRCFHQGVSVQSGLIQRHGSPGFERLGTFLFWPERSIIKDHHVKSADSIDALKPNEGQHAANHHASFSVEGRVSLSTGEQKPFGYGNGHAGCKGKPSPHPSGGTSNLAGASLSIRATASTERAGIHRNVMGLEVISGCLTQWRQRSH